MKIPVEKTDALEERGTDLLALWKALAKAAGRKHGGYNYALRASRNGCYTDLTGTNSKGRRQANALGIALCCTPPKRIVAFAARIIPAIFGFRIDGAVTLLGGY
jgi:hypothetical protein